METRCIPCRSQHDYGAPSASNYVENGELSATATRALDDVLRRVDDAIAASPALSASSAARAEPAMPRGPRARAQTGWFVSCPNAKVQESLEAIRKVIGVIVLPDADAKEAK